MEPLLVACLCAQWCGICRDWRAGFDALAAQLPPDVAVRWAWIDVEDRADALGDFEPPNFPVLAVQRGGDLLYCAPLPQQPALWLRVLTELARVDGAAARQLAQQAAKAGLPDLRSLI
ncbi:MAG: thioredoxin [Betaproteobacteria bacterium]|nr:thioredoxin [Betaproteobacteria bacterium]